MGTEQKEHEGWVITDNRQQVEEPPLYKVILHNDDYTTMDFVVMVLKVIFNKEHGEATAIMVNVHEQGAGTAGVFSRDIADTKINLVHDMAQKNEFPLKCSMEKA